MDTNALNWELHLAPMVFAYDTSFHQITNSTPFKVTYGINARTLGDFEPKQLFGEDLPSELYQRMQVSHNMQKKLDKTRAPGLGTGKGSDRKGGGGGGDRKSKN